MLLIKWEKSGLGIIELNKYGIHCCELHSLISEALRQTPVQAFVIFQVSPGSLRMAMMGVMV